MAFERIKATIGPLLRQFLYEPRAGDPCPRCGEELLESPYSAWLGPRYRNPSGQEFMVGTQVRCPKKGCYLGSIKWIGIKITH
jgi:hypothetical protein